METPKHTPGPWEAVTYCVTSPSIANIANAYNGALEDEGRANARLIAASPKLLQTLEEVLEALRDSPDFGAFVTLSNGSNIQPFGRVVAAIQEATHP